MGIGDYIILGLIVVIIAAIIVYLVKQKKNGAKCIGCPHGKNCASCCGGCASNNKTN